MNFTIKYHKPAQACMCLLGKPIQNWSDTAYPYRYCNPQTVCAYKDINYETNQTIHTVLLHGINVLGSNSDFPTKTAESLQANTAIFNGLTAYASSEKMENFSEDAYKVESQVGTATQSFSYGYTNNTYSVSVSNVSGQEDIKVNCIKFTKALHEKNASSNYEADKPICLMFSCYLDEEITIPAGSEKVFVVNFSFINA